MSRMGQKPIEIPQNTQLEINNNDVMVKGKFGELKIKLHYKIKIYKSQNEISVKRLSNDKLSKSLHGVFRKLVLNAINGVNKPFEKKLEVIGIGYRIKQTAKNLELSLGYSHPINIEAPDGIEFKTQKNTIIISGVDKQLVGQVAAKIRNFRPPEPYKGKGIKYADEIIVKKAGKAAKTQTETK